MRAGTGRRSTILKGAVLVAAALVLGLLLLCRASGPSPSSSPTTGRAPAESRSGARSESGVRIGFPETPSGAAAAIAAYQQAFAQPAILRPGVLRRRIEAVATPDYAARMLAANGPGAERIAAGPIGVGIADGIRTIYKAVPIGYKVISFGGGRAEVETWGLTIVGNLGSVEPALWFGTSHSRLTWEGDRWRIAEVESGFGPTPQLATRPDVAGGYELLELAKGLKGYAVAP
jgi:hypothetical protein